MILLVATAAPALPPASATYVDRPLVDAHAACPAADAACVGGPLSGSKAFGPLGRGRVHLRLSRGAAAGPPTMDVKVAVDLRDVRDHGAPMAHGFLTLSIPLRGTAVRIPVSIPCGASGSREPGRCRILTLAAAPSPPGAPDVGRIQILDGADVVFVQGP